MPLNPKQLMFCEQYLIDRNGAQAAIRAGYSEKTARTIASELLAKPDIAEYILQKTNKVLEKVQITQESVMGMYTHLIFFDSRKVKNPDGTYKPLHEWGDAEAYALAAIEEETVTIGRGRTRRTITRPKKVKWFDRRHAMADVAKMGGYDVPPPPPPGTPEPSTGKIELPFDLSKFTDEELTILAKGMRK